MSTTYYINQTGNVWANNISVGYPLSYNTTSLLDVNGNIKGNGSLTLTNSSATPFQSTSSSNNPVYSLYTSTLTSTILATGTNQGISYNTNIVGWNYNGGTPWGYIGLNGASGSQITYNSTGFYIGTYQAPPGSYKLQIDGTILLNGAITTNNNSINAGTGSITCSSITTTGINTFIRTTSPAVTIWDGTTVDTSAYGTLQIGRNDNKNRAHLALIRGGNYVWQFGYIYSGGYISNFGIFPWNWNSSETPVLQCTNTGLVSINTTSSIAGYPLYVNGSINCTNFVLQSNPQLACIMLQSNINQSIPANINTAVLFQANLTNSPFNALGITYSNGIFTNSSGTTISINVSASTSWSGGTVSMKYFFISSSNVSFRICQAQLPTTANTQLITTTVNANLVLAANQTFSIMAFTTTVLTLYIGSIVTIR